MMLTKLNAFSKSLLNRMNIKTMNISGIEIQINRKHIKNMHLYVKPPDGHVEVSAPMNISEKSIEIFIRTRLSWIKRQREIFAQQLRQTERQYVSGETLYLWGQKYFLQVIYSNKGNEMLLEGHKAILTVRRTSTVKQREAFVNEWYRALLKREIEKRLPKIEELCGLHCDSWQVKYMTTRWGTCNTVKRKIWLNLQLAKKDFVCLEYIILHELLQLSVHDHSDKFICLLDKFMPYWREIKNKLNNQILDFME